MREYFIYKYEWPSGHIYIGQSHKGAYRFGNANEYKSSPRVYNMMLKHPNYNKEILIDGLEEADVDNFERLYIEKYNSFKDNNPEYGLNLTTGGEGYHIVSEETRKKLSIANKGYRGRLGTKQSNNTKEKISRYLFLCLETGEKLYSYIAAEKYNTTAKAIGNAANPNDVRHQTAGKLPNGVKLHWERV